MDPPALKAISDISSSSGPPVPPKSPRLGAERLTPAAVTVPVLSKRENAVAAETLFQFVCANGATPAESAGTSVRLPLPKFTPMESASVLPGKAQRATAATKGRMLDRARGAGSERDGMFPILVGFIGVFQFALSDCGGSGRKPTSGIHACLGE